MKNVLETSVYLIIMTLICYLCIDFIIMNYRVSKVNEVTQYIEDYVEINGSYEMLNQSDGVEYVLDATTLQAIEQKAENNHMNLVCEYEAATNQYIYFDLTLSYTLGTSIFQMSKEHSCHGFGRVAV